MASQDLLSLSLDDIIKMKRTGRGGVRGRERGGGGERVRRGRGRNSGISNGQAQGARVLSTKIINRWNKGVARGRGTTMVRGKHLVTRGKGAANDRGMQRGNSRGRGGITRGRGGITRGRGGMARGRGGMARGRGGMARGRGGMARGRGGVTRGHLESGAKETSIQIVGKDSAVRQKLMRRKIQQARKTLAASQQRNRNQARLNAVDARRGMARVTPVKQTKDNLGTPLKVRVGNGTIVRGLRSDQLLLQKIRHQEIDALKVKKNKTLPVKNLARGSGSVVSLSSQRHLTVSIKNNIASTQGAQIGSKQRQRPRLNRSRVHQNSSASYTPATFTVVNDAVHPPPEPSFQVSDMPRKLVKRNIITSRDPRARMGGITTTVNVTPENVRTIPEPHRQILDPKVQKEIAMLQGKDEVTLNSGPGPGVKGFRHIPNQTSRSLNERFTEERMVTV